MIAVKSGSAKKILSFLIFLFLNFLALGIGGLFTGEGVPSEWYTNLSKAPWTPPGWVFGAAWTTIMILFAVFMSQGWNILEQKSFFIIVYAVQWVLNILWNPLFFHFHLTGIALIEISLLLLCVLYIARVYWPELRWRVLLLSPYIIWLCIATSLNAYAYINN